MTRHKSDCAIYNAPAYPVGPCNCGATTCRRRLIKDGAPVVPRTCPKCGLGKCLDGLSVTWEMDRPKPATGEQLRDPKDALSAFTVLKERFPDAFDAIKRGEYRELPPLGDSRRTLPKPRHCYVAGPMRGIPEFNFPAFHAAAAKLRAEGWIVFNPAEKDNERHGTDISKGNVTGDESIAAKEHGFNLREALALDLDFICRHADAIALLPGWEKSKGATAEHATAVALGLEIIEL